MALLGLAARVITIVCIPARLASLMAHRAVATKTIMPSRSFQRRFK